MTSGWGSGDDAFAEGDESAPSGDLGDGHYIKINDDVWRGLLHHPSVVSAIAARANSIAAEANALAGGAMDPRAIARLLPNGEAPYTVSVQNNPHTSRARARVEPNPEAPWLGMIADAQDASLLKAVAVHPLHEAAAAYPSDPFPESTAEPQQGRLTGLGFDEVE